MRPSRCLALAGAVLLAGLLAACGPTAQSVPQQAPPAPVGVQTILFQGTPAKSAPSAPTAVSTPTPAATAMLTAQQASECVAQAMQQVDAAWDKDWSKVIEALVRASGCDSNNQDLKDKLYAAYFNYGQQLAAQGKRT